MDTPPRIEAHLAANPKLVTLVELPETCIDSPPHSIGEAASKMPVLSLGEVHSGGAVNIVLGDGDGALLIAADGRENVDDIQGITGAQFGAAVAQADFAQVIAAIGFEEDATRRGDAAEYLVEGVLVDRLNENLVVDASQEGFVRQIVGVKVRGEDNQHFKWNLKLHAILQGKIIDAPVERNDPAVEQIARRNELAAEVIDEEDAVVRLHLQWGGVDARGFVQAQFQHRGNQLAPHHDVRALAEDPARVDFGVVGFDGLMYYGVEQSDHLGVDFYGIRHKDGVLVNAQ